MWIVTVVLAVVVTAVVVGRTVEGSLPKSEVGRGPAGAARMRRLSLVIVALVGAVVGMPQTTSAAGSYGAVVEKGFRGCATDPASGVVICFESPGVSSQSRSAFLQAWRAAHFHPTRSDAGPATLFVRTVSVTAESPQASRPVVTYVATADLVMPDTACREDFRFRSSGGVVQLVSVVITCKP